jgi:hypothetical protein
VLADAVAPGDVVPLVPTGPDEVDPDTPAETFAPPVVLALDRTKSLVPSRITHPVTVTSLFALAAVEIGGAGWVSLWPLSAGVCCELPCTGDCVGCWLVVCAATTAIDTNAAAHVVPTIRRVM